MHNLRKNFKVLIVDIGLLNYLNKQNTGIRMSNSISQKLRGKTIKIFGPPGTGKTENLLKRVQRYLKKGYSPDEICYISFTNKAVWIVTGKQIF